MDRDCNDKKTLLQISDDLKALDDLLTTAEDDEQEADLQDWFEKLATEVLEERDRKLDNYAALITEIEGRALVMGEEAKRLQALAKANENKAKRLKEFLQYFFQEQGYKKLETTRYQLTLCRNGGKLPVVISDDYDPSDLPQEFTRVEIRADLEAIRDALESGQELEFAWLGDRGSHLRIR